MLRVPVHCKVETNCSYTIRCCLNWQGNLGQRPLRPSTLLLSAFVQVQHRLGSTMTLTRTCVQYLAPALSAHGQPQTPSAFWYKLHNKQLQRRPSLSLSAPRLRYKLFSGRRRQVVHYQHCRASHGSGSCWSYARLSYKSVF